MLGSKIVFPGPHLQRGDLAVLIEAEKVTLTAGVPTLWLGLWLIGKRTLRFEQLARHDCWRSGCAQIDDRILQD